MDNKPKIIKGNLKKDERGVIKFINGFEFQGIKRFYLIENTNTKIIRAFHGHMKEAKYVYVITGSILLCTVFLDDEKNPSKDNKVERFILKAGEPQIIYIPPSYSNGFKALEPNSKVIFFSTATLEESQKDDFRFPVDYWGKKVWENA
ncbi:MAG: dTDP-4-dehydrorhamnose 3,5-epimerase family protein [Candidatus Daviesbacteria bacterium]|nr:dTDP-4-dehydrorhamnose 3,5-epimerase family protein [Candidatus Daviesbacteria bacterium]